MKTLFTFALLAVFSAALNAQLSLPVDFETPADDTAWNQFANAGDDPANLLKAENPDKTGINSSDSCMWFNVLDSADPWVGAWSGAFGPIEITNDNYLMEMMVYKSVVSNCGLKLEDGTGDNLEVKAPNTVTDTWEKVTFDMSAAIGNTYNRLVFFPDFPDTRESGSVCYIDNIDFASSSVNVDLKSSTEVKVYPNPASEYLRVEHPGMQSAVISNVIGQQVMSLELGGLDSRMIEVENLVPGLYFISLETEQGSISTKFLKK